MAHKKLKLLYIARFLMERTDENHTATVKDIIAYLEGLGIGAERKAIYEDLELLEEFGMDIVRTRTRTSNIYLGSRTFQLPELKMLVDVVQASPFLTQKKSMELIGKLERLTSRPRAMELRRQVFVMNRVKSPNEQLYYHIDAISQAINAARQVTFRYFDWGMDGERTYRRDGARYAVNPVALCVERYYYLVAYDEARGYVHYRVDRMSGVEVSERPRAKLPEGFDLARYVRGIFDMYHGKRLMVTLELDRSLLNVAMDRFGQDAQIRPGETEGTAVVSAMVEVSPTFLGWVAGFGGKMRILNPPQARNALVALCREVLAQYEAERGEPAAAGDLPGNGR